MRASLVVVTAALLLAACVEPPAADAGSQGEGEGEGEHDASPIVDEGDAGGGEPDAGCSGPGEACAGECGDGVADLGEPCDDDDLRGATCASQGFAAGALACSPSCALDVGGCTEPQSPCALLVCLNGGSCAELDDDEASCLCADGWTGPTCELPVAPPTCETLACENGAVCGLPFDDAEGSCECTPYFGGASCTSPVANPTFEGEAVEFYYRWQAADVTPEIETFPEAVPPPEVDLGGDVVTLPLGSAAQQLYDEHGIVLDDALAPWDEAKASALLKTLRRYTTLPSPPAGARWRVRVSSDALTNDLALGPDTADYSLITFAAGAFTLANPIEQPPHDGVERVFYSNTLYRACTRAFFRDVAALEVLLEERYGVEVRLGEPKEDFQYFSYEELITILATFEDYPAGFRQMPNLEFLTRRKNGLVNPFYPQAPAIAWVTSHEIEFMEHAFTTTSLDYLHRLIAHELAHFVYRLIDEADVLEWQSLSSWVELGQSQWSPGTSTNFVSAYAASMNPDEDFAETVSFYIYDPDWVRTIAPTKYAFLRDVLDGYEYVLLVDENVVFQVFNLYPDDTFPGRIVRVTNVVTAAGGGSHRATMELRLHQPPFENDTIAFARLFSPSGAVFRDMYFYPAEGDGSRLVGEIVFGPLDEDGYWRPGTIVVREWSGNTTYQGQSEYGWLLWFDNEETDTSPPTTDLDDVTAAVVKVGDEWIATISAPAFDQQTSSITGYAELLQYESGHKVGEYGEWSESSGRMTWTFVVRPYHASGTWTFRTFRLRDVSGNEAIHDMLDGPGVITFDITTSAPDLTPPELDLASPAADAEAANPAAPNGETDVWLRYRARDNYAGLGLVSYRLLKPSGATLFDYHLHDNFYTDYFVGDATVWGDYVIYIHLPAGSEPGAWGWMELNLCDKAGNCASHDFTELGIVAPVE